LSSCFLVRLSAGFARSEHRRRLRGQRFCRWTQGVVRLRCNQLHFRSLRKQPFECRPSINDLLFYFYFNNAILSGWIRNRQWRECYYRRHHGQQRCSLPFRLSRRQPRPTSGTIFILFYIILYYFILFYIILYYCILLYIIVYYIIYIILFILYYLYYIIYIILFIYFIYLFHFFCNSILISITGALLPRPRNRIRGPHRMARRSRKRCQHHCLLPRSPPILSVPPHRCYQPHRSRSNLRMFSPFSPLVIFLTSAYRTGFLAMPL
jgi:hypothetical protein